MKLSKVNVTTGSSEASRLEAMCLSIAWLTTAVVSIIAFVAWIGTNGGNVLPIDSYRLFPLLGLLAFSIMWSHYMAGALRETLGLRKQILRNYFGITSFAVLALICLHPAILIFQRYHDGYGLPPHSYESYVAPGLGWVTLLGTASFFIFIGFEFRRLFAARAWWRYVLLANDAAMLAIFYHGLRLGSQLQQGWYKGVWFFYGVTLIAVLTRKYVLQNKQSTSKMTLKPTK